MKKSDKMITLSHTAEIFGKPEPTLRARLRKFGQMFLHYKRDGERYIIIRDELFESQLAKERTLPRRSPKADQKDLSARVDELEKKYDALLKFVEKGLGKKRT